MKYKVSLDIIDIKQKIDSGRFAVKINSFGSILLEDTQTCEAIQLMQLPEGYSFHDKGEWKPCYIYTHMEMDNYMKGHEGWECSVCGEHVDERYDWCTCGADMRESNRMRDLTKAKLEDLLKQL